MGAACSERFRRRSSGREAIRSLTTARGARMKLYSYWRSSCSWRVRIALAFKGLPFDYAPVNLLKGEQPAEPYLQINPWGSVPVLEDNTFRLTQSPAILEYLEE